MESESPWSAYWKQCDELTNKAESLVKERILGTRKGLPDEQNYAHSFRVRDMVSACHHWDDPDYELFNAALLHDIVEDGGVTLEELKDMGFTDRTIELVRLCTHQLEIKDHTERWLNMVARLVEAKDEDAWRIKLADLADNLSQSKGLSIEDRRFMIETKAPILLRLGCVSHSAHYKLREEAEKQRNELDKQWRYVVTQWTEEYDIDGLMNNFRVVGEFDDRGEAFAVAVAETELFVRNRMDIEKDWNDVERDGMVRSTISDPNRFNKVVFSRKASRRDKTGYDSLYVFTDVVEIPFNAVAGERMFNIRECGYDVFAFFDKFADEPLVKEALFNLKREDRKPTQCHLWNKEEIADGDLDNAFDVVHTFSEDAHFSRRLIKCKQCGQLYLKEFYEEIDWVDGEDPQYLTFIPVRSKEDAEEINKVGLWELQTFSPRINRDYPKGKPKRIYWVGK